MDIRCKACFEKTYARMLDKYDFSPIEKVIFKEFFDELMVDSKKLSSPEIQREIQDKLCELKGFQDPYLLEKQQSNNMALQLYEQWKPKVEAAENPFTMALLLAIAGNIMDFGANISFDIRKTIDRVFNASLAINDAEILQRKISEAKNILYLGDNAGEIVFDKLLLETISHPNVTYVVKAAPALNDATLEDAMAVGIDKVARVITNGYDAPSTILKECSAEFLDYYKSADLIISKGQGNYEGLMYEKDSRIFFILMAKCDLIADLLNVEKGSFVVYNQKVNAQFL